MLPSWQLQKFLTPPVPIIKNFDSKSLGFSSNSSISSVSIVPWNDASDVIALTTELNWSVAMLDKPLSAEHSGPQYPTNVNSWKLVEVYSRAAAFSIDPCLSHRPKWCQHPSRLLLPRVPSTLRTIGLATLAYWWPWNLQYLKGQEHVFIGKFLASAHTWKIWDNHRSVITAPRWSVELKWRGRRETFC